MDRTTNLLGALSLAITDQLQASTKKIFERSGETAAAIVVIGYAPGLSVEMLRQVLALSHPGTVRLIDRLNSDDYVERKKAQDGRAVALFLTSKGKRLRKSLMDSRLELLESALDGLTEDERRVFGNLMAKVLTNLPANEIDKHKICRLCSVKTCSDCPIPGNAF